MNVLHLTLSFTEGGRRRAIATLAEQLRSVGVRCDLCCVGELGCHPAELSTTFGSVQALHRRSIFDDRALRALTRLCDRKRIDIIHSHDAASQTMAALVRVWRPHLRLLMTFHRSLGFESSRLRDRLRNALAAIQCGAIVTGSRERREHFLNENYISPHKVVRIPFGIDTARFRPDPVARAEIRSELGVPEDTPIVGAIGHYRREKGVDRVMHGFAALAQRPLPRPPLLVVLGDGDRAQRQMLRAIGSEIPQNQVHYAGFRRDVERWLQAWDVFVHAPRLEAFGLVIAEAMATGLPVVATPVGGILDLMRDGQTGILVPPNAPTQMADALETLLRDDELRQRMGLHSQHVVRAEYGMDLYAARYLSVYKDLQANRAPHGVDETCNGSTVSDGLEKSLPA